MRRAFQLTFVWFFAVSAGFAWAGLDMAQPSTTDGRVVLLSAGN